MEAREDLEREHAFEEARKQVTVLFADLVGFTAMSERMDPEDVREIQDAYIEVVTPPIEAYGGSVEKYIGDAVLAVFGVPQAHEDDPERAVRAALEMIAELEVLSERLEEERGIKLAMRIGVNTGLVVSRVGGDDFVVTGDSVNLAARLESAAEPGTVLVSQKTRDLSAHAFEMESLGTVRVKGKTKPVGVFRVLEVKKEITKPRGLEGLRSQLVGRGEEYEAIWGAIERVRGGEGGVVTALGEAGIGKSRLVAEVRDNLPEGELSWVEGRCLSYGGSLAYLPWVEVLRGLMGIEFDTPPIEAAEKLRKWVQGHCLEGYGEVYPYLMKLMSLPLEQEIEEKLEALDGSELRAATIRSVERVLACEAESRALVIVFEDLHWIDASSLRLLEKLLPLIIKVPILFVLVFRPRGEHGADKLLETIKREIPDYHTEVQLAPLSENDSQRLVENLLGWDVLPGGLVESILGKAEGNPFYVEEVLRSLIDQELIVRNVRTGTWEITQKARALPIPDTLHGVLVSRIDRLERDTRRVLQMGAVIGRVFQYQVLSMVTERDGNIDEKLWKLQREDLIRERPGRPEREYIFKHALTQEAAYEGILRKRRREYHGQVAEALEGVFSERIEEMLGLLAMHWERSEDANKAVDYLQRAGDQARLLYAHDEAIDYYQRALAIVEDMGEDETAARTWMKMGLTFHTEYDYHRAQEAYQSAFKLWERIQKPESPRVISAVQDLHIATSGPYTLDPTQAYEIDSENAIGKLFSGLVRCSPEWEILPDVARKWEVLDNGCRYVFHLRNDVRWSDGTEVTAFDFEYAMMRTLDPSNGEPEANLYYDIRGAKAFHQGETENPKELGVRALDEVTLSIELEVPVAYFLNILLNYYPIPKHVVEVYGEAWAEAENIVTNGPFRLESWHREESMTFVRNPDYHGGFTSNLNRVKMSLGTEYHERLEMYKANQVDVISFAGSPGIAIDRMQREYAGELFSQSYPGTALLSIDVRQPPFDDHRVRLAFGHAIDKQSLVTKALRCYHFPATGGLLPPSMPGHSPKIGFGYNPERARRLLREAGYPRGEGFPNVEALIWSYFTPVSDFLREQWWEVLSVKVSWKVVELIEYYEREDDETPNIYFTGVGGGFNDPDSILRLHDFYDDTGWRNEDYQMLVERAKCLRNHNERMQLYAQADRILIEEAAIIPLTYFRLYCLVKPWVKRFRLSQQEIWRLNDVIVEPHE